jgi:TonB family protein
VPKTITLAFLLFATSPFQIQSRTCDHPAPPEGMRYVCSPTDSCDCHLERDSSERGERRANSESTTAADLCPAAGLKYFVAPAYPLGARAARRQDTVTARLLVEASGTPTVTIAAGNPIFRESVESALRKWRFAPATPARTLTVTLTFALAGNPGPMNTTVSGSSPLNLVIAATPPRE